MKNRATIVISVFIAGLIIGAILVWLLIGARPYSGWFGTGAVPPIDTTGVTHVDVAGANAVFHNYSGNPDTIRGILCFSIGRPQVNAIRLIAEKHPDVHGFRVYYGIRDQRRVWIMVGTGSPELTDEIYVTDDVGSGPCPDLCDTESPVTKPKE